MARKYGVTPAWRQPKPSSSVGLWLEVNGSTGAAPPVAGKEGRLPTVAGVALHHVQHEGRADFISVLAFGRVERRFGRIDEILDARTDIKGDHRRRMAGQPAERAGLDIYGVELRRLPGVFTQESYETAIAGPFRLGDADPIGGRTEARRRNRRGQARLPDAVLDLASVIEP
ncbi:hypothetical protein D3C71_1445600 [compost metagenome]